jgi:hypothetical protein
MALFEGVLCKNVLPTVNGLKFNGERCIDSPFSKVFRVKQLKIILFNVTLKGVLNITKYFNSWRLYPIPGMSNSSAVIKSFWTPLVTFSYKRISESHWQFISMQRFSENPSKRVLAAFWNPFMTVIAAFIKISRNLKYFHRSSLKKYFQISQVLRSKSIMGPTKLLI